jgi:methylisocitrate lyase
MADKKSPGRKLRDLMATGETILLPGAHDPLMGRIVERLGFKACCSAGWMTGAHLTTPEPVMTMTEQVDASGKVARAVDIPVKSDAGAGYGDPIHVIRAVQEFERAGIAAIQIEDQVFPKRASYHRGLEHVTDLDEFLRKIDFAMNAREDDMVVFARTDAGNAVGGSWKEAARRVKALKELGVDAVLPMARTRAKMEQFRQEYPDNDIVMEAPAYFNSMHPNEIREYGYQIISYPLATIVASVAGVTEMLKGLLESGVAAYDAEKARAVREEVENAIGLPEFWEIERQTVEAANSDFKGRHIAGHEGVDETT